MTLAPRSLKLPVGMSHSHFKNARASCSPSVRGRRSVGPEGGAALAERDRGIGPEGQGGGIPPEAADPGIDGRSEPIPGSGVNSSGARPGPHQRGGSSAYRFRQSGGPDRPRSCMPSPRAGQAKSSGQAVRERRAAAGSLAAAATASRAPRSNRRLPPIEQLNAQSLPHKRYPPTLSRDRRRLRRQDRRRGKRRKIRRMVSLGVATWCQIR